MLTKLLLYKALHSSPLQVPCCLLLCLCLLSQPPRVNGLHYGFLLSLELKRVLPIRLNTKKKSIVIVYCLHYLIAICTSGHQISDSIVVLIQGSAVHAVQAVRARGAKRCPPRHQISALSVILIQDSDSRL